jgi:two-component system phosphate regulon sensor histidine kinase PhoR
MARGGPITTTVDEAPTRNVERQTRPKPGAGRLPLVPSTLAGRLAVTYAAVVAVVMAVFGLALARGVQEVYVDRLSAAMADEARLIARLVAADGTEQGSTSLTEEAAVLLGLRFSVVAADGSVLADSGGGEFTPSAPGRPELMAARRDGVARVMGSTGGGDDILWVLVADRTPSATVTMVGRPSAEVDAAIDRVQALVLAATCVAIALVAAVGVNVAGRIGRPLQDLRRQAAAVSAGRLDVAVHPADTRELGELGRAFNTMTTRLRSSLDELARTRGRLEATLESLSDGVAILDPRGVVLLLNPAARTMLAAESGLGRPFVEVARDHEFDALVRRALTTAGAHEATIQHGRSGRTIEATAQSVVSGDEELLLVVLRDVTELRRLENVRREFVANVSHELRTPLASIRVVVETLESGAVDDPAVSAEFLRRIIGETDRLALLVDDLLDLARLESGRVRMRVEGVAASDLIEGGVDRLRPQVERARLVVRVEAPDDLPIVRVDRARVEQVLLNLIHNAIKFTPPGGEIRVAARTVADELEISVKDNGIGVAPDELPRLFERFYKADKARRSEGTGLGLAIAKHIVLAHGGSIVAESTPGEGSTFTLMLPLGGPGRTDPLVRSTGGFPGTLRR